MPRHRAVAAAGIVLAALAASGARKPHDQAERPNVLLITLDTTRADRLGCYGRAEAGTPNLDRLAASGVRFADAWSAAPITLPSHLTMMTGCNPVTHGVRDNGGTRYDGHIPTLASRFAANGYRTAAVIAASVLDSDWGANAGFGTYDDRLNEKGERNATSVTTRALEIFTSSTDPVFLWVHYFDPHYSYEPPPPFATRYRDDPYQGEIAYMDSEIGRLLAGIDKGPRKSIVVVAADHGESLGEHGEKTHGIFTYRSTLSVPFLISGPGIPAGRVVSEPVSLVDLAPTVAELAGLPRATIEDGVSVARSVRGNAAPRSRPIYFESMLPFNSYGWVPPRGEADGRYTFIELPKREVYDLRSDPGQAKNLYTATDPLSGSLARRFESLASDLSERAGHGAPAFLSEEQRARLSSLGYFPGVPAGSEAPTLDPKDVVDLAERVLEATQLQRSGRFDDAIAVADGILRRNPENIRALAVRGQALLSQKRFREAAVAFGAIVAKAPTIASYRTDLGSSLSGTGDHAKAETEWTKAAELEPHFADPRAKLIAAYLGRKDNTKALATAKEAAASGAESADLFFEMGLAYAAADDDASAVRSLEAALRLRPDYSRALLQLGRIAYENRRVDEALARYRAASEAAPGDPRAFKQIADILLHDRNDHEGALAAYRAALAVERDPQEQAKLAATVAELSGERRP